MRKQNEVLFVLILIILGMMILPPTLTGENSDMLSWPYAKSEELTIKRLDAKTLSLQFSCFEIDCDIAASFDNPFDPDEIDVMAYFLSPSGKTLAIPAFFYQNFSVAGQPIGAPFFKVRFAPSEVGTYSWWIEVKDRNGTVKSDQRTFLSKSSDSKGFIRVSEVNPRYFAFDNGTTYFPVGHNICWVPDIREYKNYFTKMADVGENYTRIFMSTAGYHIFMLETLAGQSESGLGKYNLKNAWRLDQTFSMAENKGIHITLTIENAGFLASAKSGTADGAWEKCPYNAAQGGPCTSPEEFFTSFQAKQAFKKRLRYIIARYGYSTNVFNWQLINEVDMTDNYKPESVASWHREMANYLKTTDPFKHIVGGNVASTAGEPLIDQLSEIDFINTNNYHAGDAASVIVAESAKKRHYGKPHFFLEFGAGTGRGEADLRDINGINLHNGIWASIFAGDAGVAMFWWGRICVEPLNLYHVFNPLSEFVNEIPFAQNNFIPAEINVLPLPTPAKQSIRLVPWNNYRNPCPSNRPQIITISDGAVKNIDNLSGFIHGIGNHPELHNPATFDIITPKSAKFTIFVQGVSNAGGAKLKISLDDKVLQHHNFVDNDLQVTSWRSYLHNYDGAYSIEVPEGKHRVTVDNDGVCWVRVSYSLEMESSVSPLMALGLIDSNAKNLVGLVWFRDRSNTYVKKVVQKENIEIIKNATFCLKGLRDGRYRIEWWDTYKGMVLSQDQVLVKNGMFTAEIPPVDKDIAGKIYRITI